MAPQDIKRHISAKPFFPLRVHLTDGQTYDVNEMSHAYMSLTQVIVGINVDPETGLPRKSVYISPNHVTRIEAIGTVDPPKELPTPEQDA